jgi:AcrR family transcriptional regulator
LLLEEWQSEVPRTLNPVAHAVRRDAFLDAAQALIVSRGYEALSIQDVLDAVGASKGAFYHYFDSKSALLDGVVTRMVDAALAGLAPSISDPTLAAPEKLRALAAGIAQFKSARREFLVALIEVWLSDENAVMREHLRRRAREAMTPILQEVIAQGIAEGTFHVPSADTSAQVFMSLLLGLNETATVLYLDNHAGRVSLAEVERRFDAYTVAFDRLLGAPPGTVVLGDPSVIREWFRDARADAKSDVA